MTTLSATPSVRRVTVKPTLDTRMWQFMRWSGVLLIPLVWIHVLIKDVIDGVHKMDLNYVQSYWAHAGWRIYDAALLAFAFAHGMNGLRHIANDYLHNETHQRIASWVILIVWFVITAIGAIALVGGVRGVTK